MCEGRTKAGLSYNCERYQSGKSVVWFTRVQINVPDSWHGLCRLAKSRERTVYESFREHGFSGSWGANYKGDRRVTDNVLDGAKPVFWGIFRQEGPSQGICLRLSDLSAVSSLSENTQAR